MIDGDLQNDPADIPRLLAEIERGADLVCGYRAQRKDTLVKRLTSRIANFVRSRFTKDGVRDTGCTLKAMRRECVRTLVPFKGMHRFIPALVKGAGYRLVEIPVNHRARKFGQSKYGLGNRAVRATVDMFGVRWLLSRQLNYKLRRADPAAPEPRRRRLRSPPARRNFQPIPACHPKRRTLSFRSTRRIPHVSGQPSILPSRSFRR